MQSFNSVAIYKMFSPIRDEDRKNDSCRALETDDDQILNVDEQTAVISADTGIMVSVI